MLDLCVGLVEDHRVVAARKLSSLWTLCEHLDLEPENVLLVDDYWGTLVEAGRQGSWRQHLLRLPAGWTAM